MNKVINLKNLEQRGCNIHKYSICEDESELREYRGNTGNDDFTVRFDKKCNELGMNLPFYVVRSSTNDDEVKNIALNAKKLNCNMICSNAIKFDKDMIFNFVCKINSKTGNFMIEICDKEVPLRHMYKYETTVVRGNLCTHKRKYEVIRRSANRFSIWDIERVIDIVMNNHICNNWVEGALYKRNVGIKNEDYVIFQII